MKLSEVKNKVRSIFKLPEYTCVTWWPKRRWLRFEATEFGYDELKELSELLGTTEINFAAEFINGGTYTGADFDTTITAYNITINIEEE